MKKIKLFLPIIIVIVFVFPLVLGCKVDPREDSEIYSCYYYSLDGEDLSDQIVSYTLELRTDGVLITRYKTKKNSDSGRDDYYIDGNTLVVTTYYGSKRYDMAANEIIISEFVDNYYLLAKFRLTQSTKPATADVFSCTSRQTNGEAESNLRYFVVAFGANQTFSYYYRDKEKREIINGTFVQTPQGYQATEFLPEPEEASQAEQLDTQSDDQSPTQPEIPNPRTWTFYYAQDSQTELVLEETNQSQTTITTFAQTAWAQSQPNQ